mmetsp:Transcript_15985/g.20891  ORF Transcript_15985/g.20891 Transcript_15985/m.20891 type:complete len:331 (+) Transcript_15985:51-1043(+)
MRKVLYFIFAAVVILTIRSIVLIPIINSTLHTVDFQSSTASFKLKEWKYFSRPKPQSLWRLPFPPDGNIPPLGRCSGEGGTTTVEYFKSQDLMISRQNLTNCTNSLDVLAWLMNEINSYNETLMITYGGLIHVLREREFVRSNGEYIDDDFDTWVTPTTFQSIADFEPEIWQKFGWTLRIFKSCRNDTVLGQLVSACGHTYSRGVAKSSQDHPSIELYPLLINATSGRAKDLWQGTAYPTQLLFPQRHLRFHSNGTNATLNLQIPRYSEKILTCLYGNWSVPSKKNAGTGKGRHCLSKALRSVRTKSFVWRNWLRTRKAWRHWFRTRLSF